MKVSIDTKRLEKVIEGKTKEILEARTYDVECPHCHAEVSIHPGTSLCPSCGKEIKLKLNITYKKH